MSYMVYILRTSKGTLYIGQTNNIERRMREHKSKTIRSAKYLRAFPSFEIVYTEPFRTRREAMQREYMLKQLSKAKKERLIRENNGTSHLG